MTSEQIIPSPNIWYHQEAYELENRACDPDGVIEAAIRSIRGWDGAVVLDIGCGTGFHLPRFASAAASVIGVEPHPPMAAAAARRVASLPSVTVRAGTAQRLPVASSSVDVVHARWAYFFGPGCEPGLSEVRRVLRRGGAAFVIDNDASTSTFGSWFARSLPWYDHAEVERFWARQGFARMPLSIRWQFETRADFEKVVQIEFDPELASSILASHPGCSVDYAVNLFHLTT